MKETFHIRSYFPADFEAVVRLLRQNTPAFFAPEEEADFIHYLNHEIEQYFVVEENGAVVGCGGINFPKGPDIGYLSWDMIDPSRQGKGVGMALVQHRLALLSGIPGVKKMVVRTSQVAWRFYEKAGFNLTETVKDYWAVGFDLYHMEQPASEKSQS